MCAVILRFPRHGKVSAVLKPNAPKSTTSPRFSSSPEIVRKFSGGMTRRARQLLTADAPRPTKSAVAAVPPNASMISSTEVSMPQHSSRSVKKSRVHTAPVDLDENVNSNNGMDSIPKIARRLDIWLRAEKRADRKFTAAKVCQLIKVEENAFSQYRNAKRPLPIETADALCEKFGLSLDWLYRGDPRGIDIDLQLRMQEIEEYDKTLAIAGEKLKVPRRKRA